MRIEPAGTADIPELNRLVNSAYRGDSSRKGWTTEADYLDGIRIDDEGLREIITSESAVILVAREDEKGTILGCVNLKNDGRYIYLGMLTVNPELQSKGLGKLLLQASEKWAADHGFAGIRMNVISLRDTLIAWYERHGYRLTGEKAPFPMDNPRLGLPKHHLEFLIMQKDLLNA